MPEQENNPEVDNKNIVTKDPVERKQFAQDALRFLKERGITSPERLSRIFKAAGPGQVRAAWELAQQAKTEADKDILDCVLFSSGGAQDLDRDRMATVLQRAGFIPPTIPARVPFFRALDGALEILVPGSYDFTEEELEDIQRGVAQHKQKVEDYKKTSGKDTEPLRGNYEKRAVIDEHADFSAEQLQKVGEILADMHSKDSGGRG